LGIRTGDSKLLQQFLSILINNIRIYHFLYPYRDNS
jgi:hypothetical protein